MTEHQIQTAIVEWWDVIGRSRWPDEPDLLAIPNGGARDRITGAMLKREGVRPGVPDLLLPCNLSCIAPLWIEVKTPSGRVTPAQTLWHERLERSSHSVAVVRSVVEAIDIIEAHLAYKG